QVAKALANQFGMEYVDLSADGIAEKIDTKLVPEELIKKHLILPIGRNNGRLSLIVHDPMDLELQDMLRFRLNVELDTKLSSRSAIRSFIDTKLGRPKMVAEGESLVTESIDRTIDRSVDRSVDKSIDIT